jgi:RNA polymerase sigma-70 factor (ECF subfamily)
MCATGIPQVYSWVFKRCGDAALAEDVTSETLLAAATRYREGEGQAVTMSWLIAVARNKLVDHWRRAEREQHWLHLIWGGADHGGVPWSGDEPPTRTVDALGELSPTHQAVLSLRYFDDLPVAEVARTLGRSVHATESLLNRAKAAFRLAYSRCSDD